MTGRPHFDVLAPPTCPECGSEDVCFEWAPGAPAGRLHCGAEHQGGDPCGWEQSVDLPPDTFRVRVTSRYRQPGLTGTGLPLHEGL